MANPAHEKLLRAGVEEWNDWRTRNGSVTPELASMRLTAARLAGCDLRHARLEGATLIRADLVGADLRHADLRGTKLHEADLSDADLYRANLDGAVLAGAKLRRARLQSASLRDAQITVADLRKADFRGARLDGVDIRESLAVGASFERATLSGAELALCQLGGANLLQTTGLTSRGLESAILDESTLVPQPLGGSGAPEDSLESLLEALSALRARSSGTSVPESDVHSYHAILDSLEAHGIDTESARIHERELVRPLEFDSRTPGGEAFELSPVQWTDTALFRRKLERLIDRLR